MERALVWFKCAAMHDPVRPVLKKAAVLGWEAKERTVDLTIERAFKGAELLKRMKGWVTADVDAVLTMVERYGRLRILDDHDLVIETKEASALEELSSRLGDTFGKEVWLERMPKKILE